MHVRFERTHVLFRPILMYVLLHELAHVLSQYQGHGDEFDATFDMILDTAKRLGIDTCDHNTMITAYCCMSGGLCPLDPRIFFLIPFSQKGFFWQLFFLKKFFWVTFFPKRYFFGLPFSQKGIFLVYLFFTKKSFLVYLFSKKVFF